MVFNRISPSQERYISLITLLLPLNVFLFLCGYSIGLNDLQGIGEYKWADGTAASFQNWNTGYHRGRKGVVMKMSGNSDNGKRQTKNYNIVMRLIC